MGTPLIPPPGPNSRLLMRYTRPLLPDQRHRLRNSASLKFQSRRFHLEISAVLRVGCLTVGNVGQRHRFGKPALPHRRSLLSTHLLERLVACAGA